MITALLLAAATATCDVSESERTLRAMHDAVIAHHLDDNVDAWMAMEAETVVVGSRGILRESGADREAQRREYLAATTFEYYRDMVPPVVRVSDDCSLGWVMVQVEAAGMRRPEGSYATPFTFQSSWIELYERRDGRWLAIGNVSNFAD
jgi:hypothetical protein